MQSKRLQSSYFISSDGSMHKHKYTLKLSELDGGQKQCNCVLMNVETEKLQNTEQRFIPQHAHMFDII